MILYCRQGVLRWAILCLRSLHHKTPRIKSPHHQWHLGQQKWCISRLLFLFLQPSYQRSLQQARYPSRSARKGYTKTPWMIAARKFSLMSDHFINNLLPHPSQWADSVGRTGHFSQYLTVPKIYFGSEVKLSRICRRCGELNLNG